MNTEEHSYAMERNRSMGRDRSKDLERSNVKMFTHFWLFWSIPVYYLVYLTCISAKGKRSRILGFAVGNGEEFPLPLQEYRFMGKGDHFIGQKTD